MNTIKGLIFDLDGTLVDTAPDLARAINQVRENKNLGPISSDELRPHVSGGSPAMLKMALGLEAFHSDYDKTRAEFIKHYKKQTSDASKPFPGIDELILKLQSLKMPWGIVTNKPENLTHLLLKGWRFKDWLPSIVIGGDSLAEKKPHPMPVYSAVAALGFTPAECFMIGDSIVDMVAGKEAGCKTVLAEYGYPAGLSKEEELNYVDIKIDTPLSLLNHILVSSE